MKKADWENAYPPATPEFEGAIRQALNKTRQNPERSPQLGGPKKHRLVLILTAAVLLLGTFTAAGLIDRGQNFMKQEDDRWIDTSMAAIGDTLYLTDGYRLFSCQPGDEEYTVLIENAINHAAFESWKYKRPLDLTKQMLDQPYFLDVLFEWQGRLCALNSVSGLVFEIGWDENKNGVYRELVTLNLQSNMCSDAYSPHLPKSMTSPVVSGDKLYFVQRDHSRGPDQYQLGAYDLTTGQGGIKEAANVALLSPYRDEKLLAVIKDHRLMEVSLAIYDPAADALQTVQRLDSLPLPMQLENLEYSEKRDCAYLLDGSTGEIYAFPALKKPRKTAFISNLSFPQIIYGRGSALIGDTFYCAQDNNGLYIRNIEAEFQKPLTIQEDTGHIDEQALAMAAAETGIEVGTVSGWTAGTSTSPMAEALLSQSPDADIFVFNTAYQDLQQLIDKGYAVPAPELPGLEALHYSMYGFIQQAVISHRKLIAVPLDMQVDGWFQNRELAEKLGIERMPTTFPELIALLEQWAQGGFPEAAYDELPFECWNFKGFLTDMALKMYEDACYSEGRPMNLTDPEIYEVLALIEKIDEESMQKAFSFRSEEEMPKTLFRPGYSFDLSYHRREQLLPMTLNGGLRHVPCSLTVAVVNPFSPRQEDAWKLLDAIARHLSPATLTLLSPDYNDPIENPYYSSIVKDWETEIALIKAENRGEKALTAAEEELAYARENLRYQVYPENIEAYRLMLGDHGFIQRPGIFNGMGNDAISTLISRFAQGELSLDRFVQEMNNRIALMQKE